MAKKKSANRKAARKGKKGKGKSDVKSNPEKTDKNLNRRSSGDSKTDGLESGAYMTRQFQYVKPPDQLTLSEKELQVEHHRTLTWSDPNVSENKVRFDFRSNIFQNQVPTADDHVAVHFSLDGDTVFEDSELGHEIVKRKHLQEVKSLKESTSGTETKTSSSSAGARNEKVKNRFQFCDRACQTYNRKIRHFGVSTVPPSAVTMTGSVTQWSIHDEFMKEFKRVKQERELLARKDGSSSSTSSSSSKSTTTGTKSSSKKNDEDIMHTEEMGRALKIVERMVNLNSQDEIYKDFKYWEDQSDKFRKDEGSLLPLWRFSSDKSKQKHVTSVTWHPHFPDLFAVGFGSYNFMQQASGLVHCYSLKNSSCPEFAFTTDSGVMCVDFHPQHHSLLCVGCYDGTVLVFDVRSKNNRPIYRSSVKDGKHTDPVFQVVWQEEDLSKVLSFYSVSLDGRVANWLMGNSVLKMETVMELKLLKGDTEELEDDTILTGLAGGTCFDFNRRSEHLFVVGTEEGTIHKCSKAYSGSYLETYEGHHMTVYSVKWNTFHPNIFISCSADWTVKIWDHTRKKPLMSFDLGESVGDVVWSPYSSTVFAAVTSDGKAYVFDLSMNKHEPICEQKILKRWKLTKITFNTKNPILLCGDERGSVIALKLSPNLRKDWKVSGGGVTLSQKQVEREVARLDQVLEHVDK